MTILDSLSVRRPGRFHNTICTLADYVSDMRLNIQQDELESLCREFDRIPFHGSEAGIYREEAFLLYAIARIARPNTILETGTNRGVSTTFLAAALAENKLGHLLTIDLMPNSGELLPPELEEYVTFVRGARWEQCIDDIRNTLGTIDLFFHDSLHSYDNVGRELLTLGPLVDAKNGIILAHDAKMDHKVGYGVGRACRDFAKATSWQLQILDTTCGLAYLAANGPFVLDFSEFDLHRESVVRRALRRLKGARLLLT